MSLSIIKGSIWTTKHKVLVNTVNCEGVMGAGIALEAGLRYPEMYTRYKKICKDGKFGIGNLWIYRDSTPYWIMNFPTKNSWKLPSKIEYLELGLKKFVESYKAQGIESIAFPLLGASNGGLDEKVVLELMTQYLDNIDIPVEIYLYDPKASDDYFSEFKTILLNNKLDEIAKETNIAQKYLDKIVLEIKLDKKISQIMQLKNIKDIGNSTIKKIFEYKDNTQSKSIDVTESKKADTSVLEQQAFDF